MQKNSWVPFWECVSASHQGRADCSRSMIIPVGLTQHGCYPFFVITTNNQALDFNWSVKIFPFGFQPVWYRMMWSFKQTNDMLLEILSGVIKWMKMHSLFSCLCLPSFTLLSFQASDSSFLSFSLSLCNSRAPKPCWKVVGGNERGTDLQGGLQHGRHLQKHTPFLAQGRNGCSFSLLPEWCHELGFILCLSSFYRKFTGTLLGCTRTTN